MMVEKDQLISTPAKYNSNTCTLYKFHSFLVAVKVTVILCTELGCFLRTNFGFSITIKTKKTKTLPSHNNRLIFSHLISIIDPM